MGQLDCDRLAGLEVLGRMDRAGRPGAQQAKQPIVADTAVDVAVLRHVRGFALLAVLSRAGVAQSADFAGML